MQCSMTGEPLTEGGDQTEVIDFLSDPELVPRKSRANQSFGDPWRLVFLYARHCIAECRNYKAREGIAVGCKMDH